MAKVIEKPIIIILLLVLSIYLFMFQSDKIALTDPDETFYAQTAKEMLQKGEWLTPYLYNKPQFEKPIFFYWLLVSSFKIFGVNEFAARFPSALFAFIGLVAIYLLGRLLFSNRTGIFAAIAMATSLEYLILANACVTDMVLSTLILLGFLFFFYGQIRKKDYFYVLSAAGFALAVLTKGPIFIVLPVFTILLYLIVTKNFSFFKKIAPIFWSIVVFVLIALPWYFIMYKMHRESFMNEFFGFHNITRFITPEHKTGSEIYYNIPILLGGFFPWSGFLPFGFWQFFKQAFRPVKGSQVHDHMIFVLLWFLVIFIFFTVSSTKLPTYIFPCFISLALIVGKLWDDFLIHSNKKTFLLGMSISYYCILAAIVILLAGGYMFLKMDYPDMIPATIIPGILLILGMILALVAFIYKKFAATFMLIAYAIIVMIYPAAALALPKLEPYETGRPISKVIMSHFREGDIIACAKDYRPGIAFYAGIIPVLLENSDALSNILRSDKKVWIVMKRKNLFSDTKIIYQCGEKCLATNGQKVKK